MSWSCINARAITTSDANLLCWDIFLSIYARTDTEWMWKIDLNLVHDNRPLWDQKFLQLPACLTIDADHLRRNENSRQVINILTEEEVERAWRYRWKRNQRRIPNGLVFKKYFPVSERHNVSEIFQGYKTPETHEDIGSHGECGMNERAKF